MINQDYLSKFNKTEVNTFMILINNDIYLYLDEKNLLKYETNYKMIAKLKKNQNFFKCNFCISKNNTTLCSAFKTILPIINAVDNYNSCEKVTAMYKKTNDETQVIQMKLQDALIHVALISILKLCDFGSKYNLIFNKISPLTNALEILKTLYFNISSLVKGDNKKIVKYIKQLKNDFTQVINNQIKRLQLVCKQDSMLNAFFEVQVISFLLLKYHTEKKFRNEFETL